MYSCLFVFFMFKLFDHVQIVHGKIKVYLFWFKNQNKGNLFWFLDQNQ